MYTTPKTYLELIKLYKNLLKTKRQNVCGHMKGPCACMSGAHALATLLGTQCALASTLPSTPHPFWHALQVQEQIQRLQVALEKLRKTRKDVVVLVEMAQAKAKEVDKKVSEADAVAAEVGRASGGPG